MLATIYRDAPRDLLVIGAVVATMMVTGLLSVAGQVRRALRIDPAILLREQ